MNTTTWKAITYRYKESCLQQFTQAFITTCHVFFNKKKERFFSSLFEEKQKLCPSGRLRGGVSISTSKCCSDLLLLPLLFLQGPAQAEAAWDHIVPTKDNSVGRGMNGQWSRRRGGRDTITLTTLLCLAGHIHAWGALLMEGTAAQRCNLL